MGRRNVALLASLAAGLALSAPAAAALKWREISHGDGTAVQLISPVALLVNNRDNAREYSVELPPNANNAINYVALKKNIVVMVLAGFGCKQHLFTVTSIKQHGTKLLLTLATQRMPAGTDCTLLGPTYRVLVLPRSELARPYPTSADANVAAA
jgi:hypothetical protein